MSTPASVIALDEAVRRLILDASARARFVADSTSLNTDPRTATLLDRVDRTDLARLGHAVVRGVTSGSLCGTNLESSFARTLAILGTASEDNVARFIASPQFALVDVVGNAPGFPVSRAFYEWALTCIDQPAMRAVVQQEYVRAVLVVLATTAIPAFVPETQGVVRRLPNGWIAILDEGRWLDLDTRPNNPIAMGAKGGRMWGGRLSAEACAVLLRASDDPPGWARELATTSGAEQIAVTLRSRGML